MSLAASVDAPATEPDPPGLRVTAHTIPDPDPPYDDSDDVVTGADRRPLTPCPPPPPAPGGLQLVPPPDFDADELSFDPVRTPRDELEDPLPRAAMLTRAVLEALTGVRPVSQLSRWLSPDVLALVQSTVASRTTRPFPTALRKVLVSEPEPGIAEVTALVNRGPRVEAIALRLEGLDGRWLVTALQRA